MGLEQVRPLGASLPELPNQAGHDGPSAPSCPDLSWSRRIVGWYLVGDLHLGIFNAASLILGRQGWSISLPSKWTCPNQQASDQVIA